MKKLIIYFMFLFSVKLFATDLTLDDFIVKGKKNKFLTETFYLGQIKTKTEIDELQNIYSFEELNNYEGYNNVIKIFDDDIDLFFYEDSHYKYYKLVEINLKSSNFHLYKSNQSVGCIFSEKASILYSSLKKYETISGYYFGKIEDPTFDDPDVVFMNISVLVDNDIIQNIILYYSYNL